MMIIINENNNNNNNYHNNNHSRNIIIIAITIMIIIITLIIIVMIIIKLSLFIHYCKEEKKAIVNKDTSFRIHLDGFGKINICRQMNKESKRYGYLVGSRFS